jgi:hypothetical protein
MATHEKPNAGHVVGDNDGYTPSFASLCGSCAAVPPHLTLAADLTLLSQAMQNPGFPSTRRSFLATTMALSGLPSLKAAARDAATAVAVAHTEIWRRFMDRYNIMIDFADLDGSVLLPTPEECREGKPNALGWWSPIENGAMFNGQYMEAMINRWKQTGEEEAAAKARRLMEGLLYLNNISDVPGFIGRGVTTDGKSHYPMGSNDQSFPWFAGLWRYLESGLATEEEHARIKDHLVRTSDIIVNGKWQMPAEEPFKFRGTFAGFSFEDAPRLLFVCKMMHGLTGDQIWETRYRAALDERGGEEEVHSRIEWCEKGMVFDGHRHSWTAAGGVVAVRGLWEMEKDETLRVRYARGLQASAEEAMKSLPIADEWDNADTSYFEHDWRVMNKTWVPQTNEHESVKLAEAQHRDFSKVSPRRGLETRLVREPTFAVWIVTLAPDQALLRERAAAIERVIALYAYEKLIYSQFFPVESAWWRLESARA